MDYSAVRRVAREEFEKRVEATGLETYPCRSGYLVRGWGNEGRDIRKELEAAGLPFEMNASGAFVVSSWSLEQAAIQRAYDAAQAGPKI